MNFKTRHQIETEVKQIITSSTTTSEAIQRIQTLVDNTAFISCTALELFKLYA
jgi:hypothetical protein